MARGVGSANRHAQRPDSLAPFRRRARWRQLRQLVFGVLVTLSIVVTLVVWIV
jgi:hypothetical protein